MENIQAEDLVKELIIGFGFVEGLWIYAGINPMSEIAKAFSSLTPQGNFFGWFTPILFFLTIIQVLLVYIYGGVFGLLALLFAYLGGIFIGKGVLGIIFVIIAFFVGYWSFKTDKKISILDIVEIFRKK